MLALPTGKYTISRGTPTTNEYGDEVDGASANLATGVAGSIIERTHKNFDPVGSRIVTLRTYTGRFNHGTDVKEGDVITDEKSGVSFLVESVTYPTSVVNSPDVLLELSTN